MPIAPKNVEGVVSEFPWSEDKFLLGQEQIPFHVKKPSGKLAAAHCPVGLSLFVSYQKAVNEELNATIVMGKIAGKGQAERFEELKSRAEAARIKIRIFGNEFVKHQKEHGC